MTQDLKQRVEDAIEALHLASTRLYGYGDNNTAYLVKVRNLIKELVEREAKLIEAVKFYATYTGDAYELYLDTGAKAQSTLKELGIE